MADLVILTGAATGIGRAAASLFADAGWRCLLVDRDGPRVAEAAAALNPASGPHLGLQADLTDPASFTLIARTAAAIGPVSALVSNAGRSDPSGIPWADQSPDQAMSLVDLNLLAPARLFTALRPHLVPGARVVNVSSGAGLGAIPFRGAYSPTKAGVLALGAALAGSEPGFAFNTLCPGYVRTELVESLIASGRLDPATAVSRVPMARMASPTEMAGALLFLASPEAAPLSGGYLSFDGGSKDYVGAMPFRAKRDTPLPAFDTPSRFTVTGDQALAALLPTDGTYASHVDTSLLTAPEAMTTIHRIAADFVAAGPRDASLSLLIPPMPSDWLHAADHAAMRMAIATLACEWGDSGLRINALQIQPGTRPETIAGLLRWTGSARAQYLSGQILDPRA